MAAWQGWVVGLYAKGPARPPMGLLRPLGVPGCRPCAHQQLRENRVVGVRPVGADKNDQGTPWSRAVWPTVAPTSCATPAIPRGGSENG